jgi:hypothetical protein
MYIYVYICIYMYGIIITISDNLLFGKSENVLLLLLLLLCCGSDAQTQQVFDKTRHQDAEKEKQRAFHKQRCVMIIFICNDDHDDNNNDNIHCIICLCVCVCVCVYVCVYTHIHIVACILRILQTAVGRNCCTQHLMHENTF